MTVHSLSIANFTSLGDPQRLEPLGPVNAVIRPNNAGKSNVFRALKVLFDASLPIANIAITRDVTSWFHDGP